MIELKVNGRTQSIAADPDTPPLQRMLRGELQLNAAKYGCAAWSPVHVFLRRAGRWRGRVHFRTAASGSMPVLLVENKEGMTTCPTAPLEELGNTRTQAGPPRSACLHRRAGGGVLLLSLHIRSGVCRAGTCSTLSDSDTTSATSARALQGQRYYLAESGTEPSRKPPPARSPKPPGAVWFVPAPARPVPQQAARPCRLWFSWCRTLHARPGAAPPRRQACKTSFRLPVGAPGNRVRPAPAACGPTYPCASARSRARTHPGLIRSISTLIPGR